jgi:hypothetical protein
MGRWGGGDGEIGGWGDGERLRQEKGETFNSPFFLSAALAQPCPKGYCPEGFRGRRQRRIPLAAKHIPIERGRGDLNVIGNTRNRGCVSPVKNGMNPISIEFPTV